MSQFFHEDALSRIFASPSSWIEGSAVRQVEHLTRRAGVLRVAGMPDLHPGHKGPVGCGMTLFVVDARRARLKLDRIEKALKVMPDVDPSPDMDELDVPVHHRGLLGSVGGGNHFAELQEVASVEDGAPASLEAGGAVLLVHSGSRAFGAEVFATHSCGPEGLVGETAERYLADHDQAMAYASLNRRLIGERFLEASGLRGDLVLDVPHNFVERTREGFLHRKGAAPADRGVAPVAGSRGADSHLVLPTGVDVGNLASLAHGAGRKRDRQATRDRLKAKTADDRRRLDRAGGRVICSDPDLRVEEAPDAYKDVRQVVSDLEAFGMARSVARLQPLVTFKRSGVRA